jgi:hypothetical protein
MSMGSACGNHRHAAANQIGRQFRQAIILIVGPAVLDGNVLALDEARLHSALIAQRDQPGGLRLVDVKITRVGTGVP